MYENCFTSAVLVSIPLEFPEVTRRGFILDMVLPDSVVKNFVIDLVDSVRRLEVDFTVVLMLVVDTGKVLGSSAGKYIIQCKLFTLLLCPITSTENNYYLINTVCCERSRNCMTMTEDQSAVTTDILR